MDLDKTEISEFHKRLSELIKGEYDYTEPRRGDIVEAVILSITERDIVVDLGAKRDGIIPSQDLSLVDDEIVKSLEVGDRIPVMVWRTWGDPDGLVVSLNKGLQQEDWLRAQEMLESGEVFEGEVVDSNRGGVIVPFGRLRGFVPNSHLSSLPSGLRAGHMQEAKSELVGKRLHLAVIEVDQRRRRLVLSKRAADRRRRGSLLDELEKGQIRKGIVRNLVDFGAFIDLGGVDGLIHISELDWRHVEHPSDVLNLGDEVEVEVLSVDRERQRIGLSRKRLLPDPWHQVVENLKVDDVVEGTVTNVVPFGVFVDIGEGVEGLVHTSEMPGGDLVAETDLVEGAKVSVRILDIDHDKHQLALRLEQPWPETQTSRVRLDEVAEPAHADVAEAEIAENMIEDETNEIPEG
jgi:small subunit ribosomal protein S1